MDVRFETMRGNKAGKHEWITPPWIIESLGPFDLDPCYSEPRPWPTALEHYGITDDGLNLPWHGFVWCNPPYGEHTSSWLARCAYHRACLALIFARTDTRMFRDYIWDKALAVLFLYGRLKFYDTSGKQYDGDAGAPSCIVAWDKNGVDRLHRICETGKLVLVNSCSVER